MTEQENQSATTNSEKPVYSKDNLPPVPGYVYYDTPEIPHVHTYDGKALMGGSSVGSVLDKPGLVWYGSAEAVGTLGWLKAKKKVGNKYVELNTDAQRIASASRMLEMLRTATPRQYLDLLDVAYRAHNVKKEKAADSGTARHKLLEEYIKPCLALGGAPLDYMADTEAGVKIQEFVVWAKLNVKRFLWSEIHCYSLKMWTGGICDVGWEDMEGRVVLGDFKSAKEAYFSNWVQCSGYDLMLKESGGLTPDGVKIMDVPWVPERYCIIPFGQEKLEPEFIDNPQDFRTAFPGVVELYKLKRAYDAAY